MSGRFLLDTNIVIALFAQDPSVVKSLAHADEVFLPCIVLGELYYGAENSGRVHDNIARITAFAAGVAVLECTLETALEYGRIKALLRKLGHPIPENDLWISSLASQHDLTLITRDTHFRQIEGLKYEAW